jgi:hypothetical protein
MAACTTGKAQPAHFSEDLDELVVRGEQVVDVSADALDKGNTDLIPSLDPPYLESPCPPWNLSPLANAAG